MAVVRIKLWYLGLKISLLLDIQPNITVIA